jgi:hypothetical protein
MLLPPNLSHDVMSSLPVLPERLNCRIIPDPASHNQRRFICYVVIPALMSRGQAEPES